MSKSGKTTPVIKKAYEIAYALCRIAAKIPEKRLADALTDEAIKILASAAEGECGKAEKALVSTEYIIKLGTGVGYIDFMNGEVLLDEIALLNEVIAGSLDGAKAEPVDLSGIFTSINIATTSPSLPSVIPAKAEAHVSDPFSPPELQSVEPRRHEDGKQNIFGNIPAIDSGNPATARVESGDNPAMEFDSSAIINTESGNNPAKSVNQNSPEIIELIKSGDRQGAILEKVRQSGNCRIKDIQDLFPECSERTLRYDLQSLTGQNLIEKVGTGGPAVFYKSKVEIG